MDNNNFNSNLVEFNLKTKIRTSILNIPSIKWLMIKTIQIDGYIYVTPLQLYNLLGCDGCMFLTGKANDEEMNFINDFYNLKSNWKRQLKESIDADFKKYKEQIKEAIVTEFKAKDVGIGVIHCISCTEQVESLACKIINLHDKL